MLTLQSVVEQVGVGAKRFRISTILWNQTRMQSSSAVILQMKCMRSSHIRYLHHASYQSTVWMCVWLRQQCKDPLGIIILSTGKINTKHPLMMMTLYWYAYTKSQTFRIWFFHAFERIYNYSIHSVSNYYQCRKPFLLLSIFVENVL